VHDAMILDRRPKVQRKKMKNQNKFKLFGTKQLREIDKITLPMNSEKSHKKGGERIS